MGITLQGLGGIGSGLSQGLQQGWDQKHNRDKNNRMNAGENREAEQYGFQQTTREIIAGRAALDAPVAVAMIPNAQGAPVPQMDAQAALPMPVPGNPAAAALPPGLAMPVAGADGAADGGPVNVPPEQAAANAAGAAAVAPPAGAIPPQGPPQAPPPGAQGPPAPRDTRSRREKYQEWYGRAQSASVMSGGLEGLKMFEDHENATSRKQMLGYGMQGVAAMRDGNAGDAVKELNTMMDVSPRDTGMKWEAHDGKVYMVGSDGTRGKPYNQDAVMSIIESKLKTPENYLAFQKEAREKKEQGEASTARDVNAAANTQNAGTNAGVLDLAEKREPIQTMLDKATAYHRLATGKAALSGIGAKTGPASWWGKRNLADIESIEEDVKKGQLGFTTDSPWLQEDFGNTELFNNTMEALKEVRMLNNPNPTEENPIPLTDNGAADISRMAYFNDLKLGDAHISSVIPKSLEKTVVTYDEDTEAYGLIYKGRAILVSPEVAKRIHINKQQLPPE